MLKRMLDIIVSFFGIIILLPVYIALGITVRMQMGSPIVFWQSRPGLNGEIFNLFKFRSMTNDYDQRSEHLSDMARITKFGAWIRKTSLDELPSLLNVLVGDMSLVGPRPLLVEYLPLYSKDQARRHDVKPGITGWAQVNGRNTISWEEKFLMDVWYVENQSIVLDLKIILKTINKVVMREGISSGTSVTMEKFKGS
jgi:lipopolysaccharide/colanic/teichoic acid biosynthesis glycosyltransferase